MPCKIRTLAATAPATSSWHRTRHNPDWLFSVLSGWAAPWRVCPSFSPSFLHPMNRTFRLLAFAAALPLALSACSTGTKDGDTNVEKGTAKKMEENAQQQPMNGDSLAAGIARDSTSRPTGRELYDAAGKAKDKNHDGLAD